MTITEEYQRLPDYPFDDYYRSVNQFIGAQQYWLRVLRLAAGFDDRDWQPLIKPVDVADDMHTGLVIEIQNLEQRKTLRIHATSIDGRAAFLLREDNETREAVAQFGSDPAFDDDLDVPLVETLDQAQAIARSEFAAHAGFDAGVDRRDIFIETADGGGDYVYGEQMSIVSSICPENEARALHALELYLAPGPAAQRVNDTFQP